MSMQFERELSKDYCDEIAPYVALQVFSGICTFALWRDNLIRVWLSAGFILTRTGS